ncbi:hypothetical protein [Lelliottia wanjuensis]|uniref:hypothetical protein n=1 Tax=Lelliottia wanjuensis TaxID=3050585 RepID=UPI00254C22A5|nr:hypothetical protein [Lelliottia sp. V104_15]MDK9606323.1 hypothetical protein [Lelliottia sp. V104_15]
MNICFPARKENGTQYASVNEIMDCIGREPHGSWLAGTNTMWHGGIHLTPVTAPGSVLTADNADTAVPLQCMADGEIVAWRVNQDYLKGTYINMALQYSTGFLLVKSVCKPDPQQESTWLEFYTLYTGLAPLSAYPKRRTMVARTTVLRHPAGRYAGSAPADGVADIPPSHGSLNQGCRVIVLKEMPFRNHGEVQPFGLVKCLTDSGEATGEAFLVTLLPEYMTQDGEQYAALPGWMQHALSEGRFDSVVKPSAPVAIAAGDAVGFLQEETAPVGMGKTDTSHFTHIEVLSVDTRMPDFLRNPGKVTTGKKYIRVGLNKPVYIRNGDTFTRAKAMTEKDGEKLLERDKCNPYTAGGLTWYQISPHSWVNGDDVKEVEQFDLAGREFCALVEESDSDMKNSLREGWMRDTYSWLAERINPEKGMRQGMVSRYYRGMLDKLDTDHDGELSGRELFQAIHHPEMGVRKIVSRLAVKHDSEWFGGSSHHKWETFFQNYDPLRIKYMKQWCDTNEWMSQVPPFDKGQAVWHMHPVVFLDAIKSDKYDFSTKERTIKAIIEEARKQGFNLNSQVAYILATVKRETGDTFKPVREGDWGGHTSTDEYRKEHYRYYPYYGRGYVQITWDYNYKAYSDKLGVDLVSVPDLALEPSNSLFILIDGFKNGTFTGKKLTDYIYEGNTDFFHARQCINGLDHAGQIQDFAEDFLSKLDSGELN